jgi:nitrogen fixation NifU-like protein
MTTELALGKSLDEAYNISRDDINDSLGKLPPQKYHCSILSAEGIQKAIEDYWKKSKAKS